MKKIFVLLIATSLTANAWLMFRSPSLEPAAQVARASAPAGASSAPMELPAVRLLTALDTTDLEKLREALRAAGCDESSIRAVIDGALRQRYRAQIATWRIERWRTAWWRGGLNAPGGPAAPSQRALVHEPLQALLGRDPLDLVDAEARYDFLPLEKRRLLAEIDVDYSELRARTPRSARTRAATKSELDEQQLLVAERRKDVLAVLTPEERAEYELRFSKTAAQNARRFAAIDVTEKEFRAIEPLIDTTREQTAGKPPHDPARLELEQRTLDQLVATIGYDRALDYVWGMDSGPYATTARVLRDVNLPAHHAGRLLQLAADTGAQATAIHYDASLSADQKRAALTALQQTVRPQLDALVPPAVQPKLDEHAIGWFTMMSEGRYTRRQPTLAGSGYMGSAPIAVTSPATGPHPVVPGVRPPEK